VTDAFLQDERLVDLMIQRTIEGLDVTESEELYARADRYAGYDDDAIDRIAAALMLSAVQVQPLPTKLRSRLDAAADAWLATRASGSGGGITAAIGPTDAAAHRPRGDGAQWVGWLAAASVLVAALGWWRVALLTADRDLLQTRLAQTSSRLREARSELEDSLGQLAATAGRERAVQPGPGALKLAWAPTEDVGAGGASGELVWDNQRQTGFMRLAGLDPNDPRDTQYQLWIFDATRDDRHPVDGGVFDIPAGRLEVIVPIQAKLAVGKPVLFAVTIERPGGVVVSEREHVVVVARPDQEI